MQKNYFSKFLLNFLQFLKKNIYIFVIIFIILTCQLFWFWNPFNKLGISFEENSDWKILKSSAENRKCMDLNYGHKLSYSFIISSKITFKINFLEKENEVNLVNVKSTNYKKGIFAPPKDGHYCLIWTNISSEEARLNYSTQLIIENENNRIPVKYKVALDKLSLQIVSGSGEVISNLRMGSPILNFEINKNSTLLAVSVADKKTSLRIFDLKNNQQIIKTIPMENSPRFLAFSNNDFYLTVGNEHTKEIIRVEVRTGIKQSMKLPLLPLALLGLDNSNELLVRAEKEVIKIRTFPLEIIERNARIEFLFGDEIIYADPNELCTVHGIPHPLFTPRQVAMSTQGLRGFYFQTK